MFSFILAQIHRHCPHPVEQSNPVLLQKQAECHIPSYSYITLLSAAPFEQHPCHIAGTGPSTAFQPISFVDADVEQALIPLSILAPEGKRGGYMVLDS